MMAPQMKRLLAGFRITSLGTLASRVLGMLRDVATASLLGLSAGGVMDAFALAFRVPNLFRRLFGEGALSASYLPLLVERLEDSKQAGWQLTSALLSVLTVLLALCVLAGWGACGLLWYLYRQDGQFTLLLAFTAALLPYLILICLAAQISATLHSLGHFRLPAFTPVVLNIAWLAAAWWVAPALSDDQATQAYVLIGAILVGGLGQVAVQLPALYGFGFRYDFNWAASRRDLAEIVSAMTPTFLGLAVTQVNTLLDSVLAWTLAGPVGDGSRIDWLGGVPYPMEPGATAAIYFGERMYQFPLGLIGIAVSTAIFPLLSRHAARGELNRVGADLTLGLRLVLAVAIPASVGLATLAGPIAQVLFQHGEFTDDDAARTAGMIACYSSAVWAYCALPVLIRGYYAVGDRRTPLRTGLGLVGLNLALNLALVWPFAERGLAIATAVSATAQLLLLAAVFSRYRAPLGWAALAQTAARAMICTIVMGGVLVVALAYCPAGEAFSARTTRLLLPLAAGSLAYFIAAAAVRQSEWLLLLGLRDSEDAA